MAMVEIQKSELPIRELWEDKDPLLDYDFLPGMDGCNAEVNECL